MDWLENDAGFLMILGIIANFKFTEILQKFTGNLQIWRSAEKIGLI